MKYRYDSSQSAGLKTAEPSNRITNMVYDPGPSDAADVPLVVEAPRQADQDGGPRTNPGGGGAP